MIVAFLKKALIDEIRENIQISYQGYRHKITFISIIKDKEQEEMNIVKENQEH